jgi:hypothetical protein
MLNAGSAISQQEACLSLENAKSETIPPHMARFLAGAPKESDQFGFLIGSWFVQGIRYDASGNVQFRYRAHWRAEHLHDKRMVLDDFTFLSPAGEELSAFVTLRTYAPTTQRWEIAGLAALEPGLNGQWTGCAVGEEMHFTAEIRLSNGTVLHNRERFYNIEAESFRWESHNSHDDRASWTLTSALVANRGPLV